MFFLLSICLLPIEDKKPLIADESHYFCSKMCYKDIEDNWDKFSPLEVDEQGE